MSREEICVVSSSGGHLTEAFAATAEIEDRCVYISSNDEMAHMRLKSHRAFYLLNFHTNMALLLVNALQATVLVLRLRPKIVITTGAGMVVPFCLFSRLIGARLVFIETAACIDAPSRTGKILKPFASHVFVQWKELLEHYPEATHGGPLF